MVAQHKGALDLTRDTKWVNVTWMPHTTLSQTSHVCLTIRSAHASLDDLLIDDRSQEWKVRVGVYGIGGVSLVPVATHTPCAPVQSRRKQEQQETTGESSRPKPTVSSATHDAYWDYFIHLPIRWRDLPRDAYLLFEILGGTQVVVYQGTMPFFSRYGKLATGLQKVTVQAGPLDTRNHGLMPLVGRKDHDDDIDDDPVWKASYILDQLNKRDERPPATATQFGEIASVPWLDGLLRERAMEVLEDAPGRDTLPLIDDSSTASLIVELPTFDIPIMHEETFYPVPQNGASGAVTPHDLVLYRKQKADTADEEHFHPLQLVPFPEYENEDDNPVEDKYRTLAHDLIRGLVDPALKPDREQRKRLAAIIESPGQHPSREEKDLLWRFRFSLVDNRRALTKFLLAVDWSVEGEVIQAAELLEQWRKRSPIEVTDALKLLGKHVAFQTNLVRDYAIDTLAAAPDSELRLYLLQLVQALKYESTEAPEPTTPTGGLGSPPIPQAPTHVSALATFLIKRAAANMQLANFLYW
jgi:phosphatidylinositol 3-kinase